MQCAIDRRLDVAQHSMPERLTFFAFGLAFWRSGYRATLFKHGEGHGRWSRSDDHQPIQFRQFLAERRWSL